MRRNERDHDGIEDTLRSANTHHPAPEGLAERIVAMASTDTSSPRPSRTWRWAAAGAAVGLLLAAVFYFLSPREPMVVVAVVKAPATDGQGHALTVGEKLPAGAVIRTGAGGRVTLLTRRGSEFTLNEQSVLHLARDGREAELQGGELYYRNRAHELSRIATAAGEIKLLGTTVNAAMQQSKQVVVTVLEGKVQLANTHGQMLVPAGQRAVFAAWQAPGAATPASPTDTAWYSGKLDMVSDYGEIAYYASRDGMLEIWAMNEDGSNKHLVKRYLGSSWDAPGPWLAGEQWIYVKSEETFQYLPRRMSASYLLDTATGQELPLTVPENYICTASISPDARRIIFYGSYWPDPDMPKDVRHGLWSYDIESGQLTQLLEGYIIDFTWAPDSRHAVIARGKPSSDAEDAALYLMDFETGALQDLEVQGTTPRYSPDGDRLTYCRLYHGENEEMAGYRGTGQVMVWEMRDGASPQPVSPPDEYALSPTWSPEGNALAYRVFRGLSLEPVTRRTLSEYSVHVVSLNDTETREVYRDKSLFHREALSWDRTGQALYIAGDNGIVKVAADGSGVMASLGGNAEDSVLSGDERAQLQQAAHVVKDLEPLKETAWQAGFKGQVHASQEAYRRISTMLSNLTWQYPLLKLSTTDVYRYVDVADQYGQCSVEQFLQEVCNDHFYYARYTFLNELRSGHDKLPDNFTELANHQIQRYMEKDRWFAKEMLRCPKGNYLGTTTPYVYHAPVGGMPRVGDVLLTCPLHPTNTVVWDEKLQTQFDTWREHTQKQE